MEYLYIHRNCLEDVSQDIIKLQKLKELYMDDNNIISIPYTRSDFPNIEAFFIDIIEE